LGDAIGVLHTVSIVSLVLAGVSFLVLAVDIYFHRQKMTVMNLVRPVTALYLGPFTLAAYFWFGRNENARAPGRDLTVDVQSHHLHPYWQTVCVGTTHCGAGCTLGDIAAEWLIFLLGISLWGSAVLTSYICDFSLAYILGVAFQYFAIAPMRGLHGWAGIRAALKADTVSLVAFEVGLFVFMYWMRVHFQPNLNVTEPEYWFLMQVGMALGFLTSYPANWWLIRHKWKEAM
jgi:hypothetical protein